MSTFVALDLETAGNEPDKDQILQVAAIVFDSEDMATPIEELPTFSAIVNPGRLEGNAFALHMNAWLLYEIATGGGEPAREVKKNLEGFLLRHEVERATLIGANVMSFDLPFLRNWHPKTSTMPLTITTTASTDWWGANDWRFNTTNKPGEFFHYRGIDLGTLFATKDGPSSTGKMIGELFKKKVAHDALEDARDAVRLWRYWSSQR